MQKTSTVVRLESISLIHIHYTNQKIAYPKQK